MSVIWATRGREWGFRFLLKGGQADPLSLFEATIGELGQSIEGVVHVGDRVAVRFSDPEGRTDRAGRAITHDFVLSGDAAAGIESVEDARVALWPVVAAEYQAVWDKPTAPAPLD